MKKHNILKSLGKMKVITRRKFIIGLWTNIK